MSTFSEQISLNEYERQKRDYTAQMVQHLTDQIRRDPQVADSALHFRKSYLNLKMTESVTRCAALTVLLGLGWAASTEYRYPFQVGSDSITQENLNLSERIPSALAGDYTFLKALERLPVLLGFSIVLFLLWIATMFLESRLIHKRIRAFEMVIKVVLDLIVPLFAFFILSLFAFYAVTHWAIFQRLVTPATNQEGVQQQPFLLAQLEQYTPPVIQSLLSGVFSLVLRVLSNRPFEEIGSTVQLWVFLGFTGSALILYSLQKTVLHFFRPRNLASLLIWAVAVAQKQLTGDFSVEAGESLVLSYILSKAVGAIAEFFETLLRYNQLNNEEIKERVLADEPEEVVSGDEDDDSATK